MSSQSANTGALHYWCGRNWLKRHTCFHYKGKEEVGTMNGQQTHYPAVKHVKQSSPSRKINFDILEKLERCFQVWGTHFDWDVWAKMVEPGEWARKLSRGYLIIPSWEKGLSESLRTAVDENWRHSSRSEGEWEGQLLVPSALLVRHLSSSETWAAR